MTAPSHSPSPFSALGGIPGVTSACVLKLPSVPGPVGLEELYSFGKAFDDGREEAVSFGITSIRDKCNGAISPHAPSLTVSGSPYQLVQSTDRSVILVGRNRSCLLLHFATTWGLCVAVRSEFPALPNVVAVDLLRV
eukprot:CAMPEP_0197556472 /NCGR_PEP_ID=MMETSP1320-20131121/15206_1 /TAXON_ID=91990 /ORGANISM="Bolidomonas sp., Strain RCC2347" /LENGTH=136 /DNA_ID=CAMNT_0043117605 /DNA_START=73 /DNA_END=479 /DNA_ORIENTATION=-